MLGCSHQAQVRPWSRFPLDSWCVERDLLARDRQYNDTQLDSACLLIILALTGSRLLLSCEPAPAPKPQYCQVLGLALTMGLCLLLKAGSIIAQHLFSSLFLMTGSYRKPRCRSTTCVGTCNDSGRWGTTLWVNGTGQAHQPNQLSPLLNGTGYFCLGAVISTPRKPEHLKYGWRRILSGYWRHAKRLWLSETSWFFSL